ncbi:Structural maintenance of chromosomes protein 2 [Tilletia horrida]|uniref:Structural maintenance of chromosomes protein n=1 Tax=Tilletia horrida TaxID=155126 RepID=A0AAN6JT95_9BASI|nr:Structural maintenance of chromosomes protein 2 [Tilletia horrida]KAK0556455.1 Structural maintenance of chromosomes protein 2 [Tilletia horrida]
MTIYPVRTTVSGFDPSFNAITGLNGSGKSNILDAICFVLGITNLTAVRANNLQDLIYKRGQAGVTKASVTVVFDNSDRKTSPISFENYAQITVTRQIAMGGLSKYLINGHKATQQAVQNMFQSVQLNINNPNFLIMQGKITKVLNMKPAEILGMIEEAAGTRMFEDRKEKAIKTIAKKDQKVKEICALLDEEITPKLDKLREEKRSFLEYQKASSELERLTRLAKAYEWKNFRARLDERSNFVTNGQAEIDRSDEEVEALRSQITQIDAELERIEKKREKELTKGGKLQALSNKVKHLENELVSAKAVLEIKISTMEEETETAKADAKSISSLKQQVTEKEHELSELQEMFAEMKEGYDKNVAALEKEDELLQTLLTGMASKGQKNNEPGNQGGYLGQIAAAKADEAAASSEISQAKLKITHLEKEIAAKRPKAEKARKDNAGLLAELQTNQKKAVDLEGKLGKLSWDEEKERNATEARATMNARLVQLLERRDSLKSQLSRIDFDYTQPHPEFDRSKVKGLVVSLVKLDRENNAKYASALEVCAGGRLYNVVVEDEKVGSQLLSKGNLKKRVTLIPLNKIHAFVASAQKIGAAQRIAPGKVNLALDLIGSEAEVSKAMQYVFGDTLICDDADTARKVTFDDAVKLKSVTLDGDVYSPAGTLSGGSRMNVGTSILLQVQELRDLQIQIDQLRQQIAHADREAKGSEAVRQQYVSAKRELQLKQHEVKLLTEQLEGSNASRMIAEVEAHQKSVQELREAIASATEKQKAAAAEAAKFEKDWAEFNNNKDSKLDELRASIKQRKAQVVAQSAVVKKATSNVRTLELEVEGVKTELEAAEETASKNEQARAASEKELGEMRDKISNLQSDSETAQAKLNEERATLSHYDEELSTLREAGKAKRQEIADAELRVKAMRHDIEKAKQDCNSVEKQIKLLESQYEWLITENRFFGQAGSAYDFGKHNMSDIRKTCKKLEEQQAGMKKKINPKVLNMIDSVEKKESSLKHMMSTVLKDKSKIEETIQELDRYKRDALQRTWTKVNGDFGDIFNELLPGNYAKLQPPEGQDVTQGLEVKVRLGQIWKQSLTELSGGQRSLIALSLIMSLLQFKPAPMYILDEIDAALDLSHTQHIGQLFKSRFSGSQFIVVSLKEGLFTNANVLFRARFRDGTSIVERVAQRGVDQGRAALDKENEAPRMAGTRGAGRSKASAAVRAH